MYVSVHLLLWVQIAGQGKIAVLMSDGVIEHYILFNELELVYDSEEAKLDINVSKGHTQWLIWHTGSFRHYCFCSFNVKSKLSLCYKVNTLPSLPLKCASEEQIIYTVVSHAAFVSEESQDHVLVSADTKIDIEPFVCCT